MNPSHLFDAPLDAAPTDGSNACNRNLFPQGQIRLRELSVYNWGSFHGLHNAPIDAQGTLVTGDNGAGKSTLIDGLMALLLPAGKASFNVAAAQGDRSDRTLLSYMRGSYGSDHDGLQTRVKSKRDKAVASGLRALYTADDGSEITLLSLLWNDTSSHALKDVKRVYVVAKRNLSLKAVLDTFGEGNARQLKRWLKADPAITCCDDRFKDYQELYRKLLHMDNKNAPALLSRALGLKKIDDLTQLIRELVLEPSTVKDSAQKIVEEFADLEATHHLLQDAKKQVSALKTLPEWDAAITETTVALQRLHDEKDGLSAYWHGELATLWQKRLTELSAQLERLQRHLDQSLIAEQDAEDTVTQRHEQYLQLGGQQIESLQKDLTYWRDKLKAISQNASDYQQDCRSLNEDDSLSVDDTLSEDAIQQTQAQARTQLSTMSKAIEASQDHFAEVAAQVANTQAQLRELHTAITAIQEHPDSNVDTPFQRLRQDLTQALPLTQDELPFVAELMSVKEEESPWQGAIERALGGLRTTLLVPADRFSLVTRWLNQRHTGLHVRVQTVDVSMVKKGSPQFQTDGFLGKLQWREHPYRDWLKHFLASWDLHCVADTDALDTTPYSMTQAGLIHKARGRFEKKDQHRITDRRHWSLGFSNKARLAALETDYRETQQALKPLQKKQQDARDAMDRVKIQQQTWQRLLEYDWANLNAPYWQHKIHSAEHNLAQLQDPNSGVEQARRHWEMAKQALADCKTNTRDAQKAQAVCENTVSNAELSLQTAQSKAVIDLPDAVRQRLAQRVGRVSLDADDRLNPLLQSLVKEIERVNKRKNDAASSANIIMSNFRGRDQWQPLTVDWPKGLEGLQDFLAHLTQLQKEGLPALVEQFQARLNKHTTQSLARIKTQLDSEREDIHERIDTINQVLRRTEFKVGSFLRLGTHPEKFPHVHAFEQQVRTVLSQATSNDHETRFTLLQQVVSVLNKASTTGTAHTLESQRLLDPRHQMTFYAEEVGINDGEVRDVLASSGGKSGGEKESFAGTIVAASLAYVLTPNGSDKPIYSTVFLDEAFSNTAEAVSRRVLKVFKALHIHVNLITPYKNLNLARESARSLLIAERNPTNHESRLCDITWEEIDRRRGTTDATHIEQQAAELGVQLDDNDQSAYG